MLFQKIHEWYTKFERPIGTLSLIGGFLFNVFTLTRVDRFMENFWVVAHLLVVAVCTILLNRNDTEKEASEKSRNLHFWLTNVLQFFYGGLLSTFIVFYFRSAVITVVWPFFLVLGIAFILNESQKKRYTKLNFQIGYFVLCLYLFFIFFVPIIAHETSRVIFLASGGMTLAITLLFLVLVRRFAPIQFNQSKKYLLGVIGGIFITMNMLYFFDLIPPLPLSLQDAGVFHGITRQSDGNYRVSHENINSWQAFLQYLTLYPDFHTTETAPVYAYSAIFSPVSFTTKILHEWQYFDLQKNKWVTEETIELSVIGGRENGYRTYSMNTNLAPGRWRVNVKTKTGQIIGRMNFTIIRENDSVPLFFENKS